MQREIILRRNFQHWIEEQAASDAITTLNKYPSPPPEVAPINSYDGLSNGESSYLTISVNTAFSIVSMISDSSPPAYLFQDVKEMLSDATALGGSRTTSSDRTRTWADTVGGRRTSATELPNAEPAGIYQSTIISDLESSRAEVETLKSKVAQLEVERIEHQKTLASTVQEQVSKAVQDQMMQFTAQMTQMFANLVSSLHQVPRRISKRSAQDMEADDATDQSVGESNSI